MISALRRISTAVMLFAVVASSLAHVPSAVIAQEGGSGLQISPTRTELSVEPGEIGVVSLTLKNVTSGDIIAQPELNDFESDDNTGEPRLIKDRGEPMATSLQKFIDNLTDVELKPGETKEVKINIDVSLDSSPGAYYGALVYAAVPKESANSNNDGGQQVALTASVAPLVLLTVPGDITESASFDSLMIEKEGKAGTFFTSSPDDIAIKLTNSGNGFVRPYGKVSVMKGGEEVHSYELNDTKPRGNILPDSSRTFRNKIENAGGFGQYKIIANASYAEGGEVLTQEKTFYVIPVWMWALAGLLLIAIIVGLYLLRKRMVGGGRPANKRR